MAKAPRSDPLATYRQKRDFGQTPEPKAAQTRKQGRSFVVQKHDATRLHFDFRLEHDGVLKSWAVTRGPSFDPADKRLAVRTEDHPLDYGGFEGVIPKGQYGGGSVMLWDRGTWEPEGDPDKGLAKGHLAFRLDGERLKGGWHLVRMAGNRKGDKGRENWLLIKSHDDYASESDDPVERFTTSVASGAQMEQIASGDVPVWDSSKPADEQKPPVKSRGVWGGPKRKASRRAGAPEFIEPELATLADAAPQGDGWLHEIKYDGYRLIARKDGDKIALFTRNGYDWTDRFPGIAEGLKSVKARTALLDGEAAFVRENGITDFKSLQDHIDSPHPAIRFFLFDLLELEGKDYTGKPLVERKGVLATLLRKGKLDERVLYSDHVEGQGVEFHAHACGSGLEGIISKKASAPYRPGRTKDWLKVKCGKRAEFVIGGYSKSTAKSRPFASLLLGTFEGDALNYMGRVGTGFDEADMARLAKQFKSLERKTSPFGEMPASEKKGAVWLNPTLVCEVAFTEQTRDGRLRHPSFQGLREDKAPKQVHADKPVTSSGKSAAEVTAKKGPKRTGGGDARDEFGGVKLTSPDRVLYPEIDLSKRDLADYYQRVAPVMAPYVVDRLVSLLRCPDGAAKECFFQRHSSKGMSDLIKTLPDSEGGKEDYLYIEKPEGLFALVQVSALELHDWGSTVDAVDKPDKLVFDLDPDEGYGFAELKSAVVEVRDFLDALGLKTFLKATGGKGLHLTAPIARRYSWDEAKAFAKGVADALEQARPDRYTANMAKKKRTGKIFVDYLRNQRGGTSICNYSTRAKPGATVAVPLRWDELDGLKTAAPYDVETLPKRLESLKRDPWEGFFELRQTLSGKARKTLGL